MAMLLRRRGHVVGVSLCTLFLELPSEFAYVR